MSVQVSCPVFRCPKTSVSQCTGHRRVCERYYCTEHSPSTLCDRCASIKREERKSTYREMLRSLERKAYSASLTFGVIALALISVLLLGTAIVLGFMQSSDRSLLLLFILSLVGAILGLIGGGTWYLMKAREYMRAESVELDLKYPGFYDYYRDWLEKVDEITSDPYVT